MPPLIPPLYLILPTYEQDNYVAEMGLVSTFDMCQNYFITKMYIKYETIANIMRSQLSTLTTVLSQLFILPNKIAKISVGHTLSLSSRLASTFTMSVRSSQDDFTGLTGILGRFPWAKGVRQKALPIVCPFRPYDKRKSAYYRH